MILLSACLPQRPLSLCQRSGRWGGIFTRRKSKLRGDEPMMKPATSATLNERFISKEIFNARRGRDGSSPKKAVAITCHSPPSNASVHGCTTHELGRQLLLFASLLFILLHQKKLSFCPTPALKPAASATRGILMVQSKPNRARSLGQPRPAGCEFSGHHPCHDSAGLRTRERPAGAVL
jgi:hypothetical protein